MSRCTLRYLFTVLLYAGVAIFLWPYFTGRITTGIFFMIAGAGLTILCGILRCCLTEGDCSERTASKPCP